VNALENELFCGDSLDEVELEAARGLEYARKVRVSIVSNHIESLRGLGRMLRGSTRRLGSLDDSDFDEQRLEATFAAQPDLGMAGFWYWVAKLQARYHAGQYDAALEASAQAERLHATFPTLPLQDAEWHFYTGLSHAAGGASDAAARHLRQLRVWANHCPDNFENRATLVAAEMARCEGHDADAMRLYEQAIRTSRESGFVHNEALACELAARFYASRGLDEVSDGLLRKAHAGYSAWGAAGKVRRLEAEHSQLLAYQSVAMGRSRIDAPIERLDLATVLKISETVTGEIRLDKLVDALLRTAVEHAGAERAFLIRSADGELRVRATATTEGGAIATTLCDAPLSSAKLPESIVRYAARTHEPVIVDDASTSSLFARETYACDGIRSVMCLPLVRQGRLVALLYLENNLAPAVFTPSRVSVLTVLAAQAATSLEIGELYTELEQREAKIRRLIDANIIGMFTWSLDGRIFDANDEFLRIVGYDREALRIGIRWTDLTPAEWLERDRQLIPQLNTTGALPPFEKEYFRKDGSRVPVLVGVANFQGNLNEGVAFVIDLTDRRRAEEELRHARAALAHRQRVSVLGELTASLAHEIKQPIVAALIDATACLRALAEGRSDIEQARQAASRMVTDAKWADEVINRTRALYKDGAVQHEIVDVNALIRELIVLLRPETAQHGVTFLADLAGNVPRVTADRVQLQQVLMNLMINAVEAMSDVAGVVTVTTETDTTGDVMISIADTGVGIPETMANQMFEAFVTTKPEGTGLGLAISRSIVEAHGGRLWAVPNVPRGAVFRFSLPRAGTIAAT